MYEYESEGGSQASNGNLGYDDDITSPAHEHDHGHKRAASSIASTSPSADGGYDDHNREDDASHVQNNESADDDLGEENDKLKDDHEEVDDDDNDDDDNDDVDADDADGANDEDEDDDEDARLPMHQRLVRRIERLTEDFIGQLVEHNQIASFQLPRISSVDDDDDDAPRDDAVLPMQEIELSARSGGRSYVGMWCVLTYVRRLLDARKTATQREIYYYFK